MMISPFDSLMLVKPCTNAMPANINGNAPTGENRSIHGSTKNPVAARTKQPTANTGDNMTASNSALNPPRLYALACKARANVSANMALTICTKLSAPTESDAIHASTVASFTPRVAICAGPEGGDLRRWSNHFFDRNNQALQRLLIECAY